MVRVIETTPSTIKLSGVSFTDGEKVQRIMDICHKYKHMYKEGYPCGRKTRKRLKRRLKRWTRCPEICFTYLITDDNQGHHLAIHVLTSETERLLKKYTTEEIEHYMQMYTQNVADEIVATI